MPCRPSAESLAPSSTIPFLPSERTSRNKIFCLKIWQHCCVLPFSVHVCHGQDVQAKHDLTCFVKWPSYIQLQCQRVILEKHLKVPFTVSQFIQALDNQTGMASLIAKDSYFQSLARKVCAQENQDPRKRKLALKRDGSEESVQPKKRKKPRKRSEKTKPPHGLRLILNTSKVGPATGKESHAQPESETKPDSFFAVDLLRKRLHEKIQEARGQGTSKGLSLDELERKRQRRKQERERKKRKRKKLKERPEEHNDTELSRASESASEKKNAAQGSSQALLLFNKVEVHEQKELNHVLRKKQKKQSLKGKLSPLTGKNFRQLLSRLDARKSKLEDLKTTDEKKAQELENKMKWTNVLYKAEGVKIKDNEELLKAALKRKEKRRTQRQKQWGKRTEQTVEKMQQRQDKRRRNIQKKKRGKMERKKERARKKGRILPGDLN
ncbi:surfeit locus protein 6 isoform X2 [Rhinatrema bivittatum]|uniref:surfeit locus protein 6 isoform X2 n=1 Tax=Rhinatrema bivittatum TaxID=194408 RepID=UPI00112685CD|nr:surfeit locus protein 6 isoform X2 [Rhinatrema bivittatum]